jgi:glycosyltransferase involved in cell wall biosynthesis
MSPLRVLITNMWLKRRSGTEIVTMELAHGLARRGHEVVVFAHDLGASGEMLRREGIRVTDRLDDLEFEPDVIHGNHSVDLVHGMIAYPGTPGVFVCHNPSHWICSPPDLSRVRAFVSVDRLGGERIAHDLPRARNTIRIVHNAVDLGRYQLREPLPQRPTKALILTKEAGHLSDIQAACKLAGLETEAVGPGVGVIVDDLPRRLREADIVFATARMAIEAMAVGCAVVVVDERGLAGMVTDDVVADWRDDNFGQRLLTRTVTVEALVDEIARYDAAAAARVAADVRANNNLDRALSIYESIYRDAIDANNPVDAKVEVREMSRLLRWWLPTLGGEPQLNHILSADNTERGTASSPVRLLLDQIRTLNTLLRESEADRAARLEQIHTLTALIKDSEADRAARLEQIHTLTALLNESETDRAARLEQIHTLTALIKDSGRNDAKFLEAAFGGLTSLSSGFGSVRADDGICLRHDRYLSARSFCAEFSPAGVAPLRLPC